MSNSTVLSDRLSPPRSSRAPLAAAGAAVLGLSLLLSVGPALGAANSSNGNANSSNGNSSGGSSSSENSSPDSSHGTSGNVKVHDAGTGLETAGTDNEPHVCAFWLEFTLDAPFEAGTWVVVSWAPTGDGSTVATGVYDTAGDGIDSSSVIDLPAGHYRVEWAATGANSSKKKTFWVDACDEPAPAEESQAEESQAEESQAEESQAEESQAEEPAPPTDAPGSPAEETQSEETQAEEFVLAGGETSPEDDASQPEAATSTDEEPPIEELAPTDAEDIPPVEEEEQPVVEDVTTPSDPSDAQEPAEADDAGPTDPGTPPAQDELGGIGGSDEPTMADTATPAVAAPSGLLAALGLLMLIVLHTGARRVSRSDRDNATERA